MGEAEEIQRLNEDFKPSFAKFLEGKGHLVSLPLQISTVLESIAAGVRSDPNPLFSAEEAGALVGVTAVKVNQLYESNLGLEKQYPAALQRIRSLVEVLNTVKDVTNVGILQVTLEAGNNVADTIGEAPWNF